MRKIASITIVEEPDDTELLEQEQLLQHTIITNATTTTANTEQQQSMAAANETIPAVPRDYYNSGSTEDATDTPLVINRLEARRRLTKNSTRLVICLVGLPARGKSFVARKLLNFLEWYGCQCKIFNVGKYRRKAYAEVSTRESKDGKKSGACDADFFDSSNKEAAALREQVAEIALRDMLKWIDNEHDDDYDPDASIHSFSTVNVGHQDRIAIFDATNSTDKRRRWVLEECTDPAKRPGKPTGVVFVESICDDQELLDENFRFKVTNSPDYAGVSEEEAMADLRNRVKKYEDQYETITDDSLSYIKIFNLSTKLLVNHIYGRMSKVIVPALMAWNIGSRPIFLCRPGQTLSDITTDRDDYVTAVNMDGSKDFKDLSLHSRKRLLRGDKLGPGGKRFSDALYDFVFEECMEFALKRASIADNIQTGTSISGLAGPTNNFTTGNEAPFTIKIYSSTMPRASETVRWDEFDFPVTELSTLNPLDKGDLAGKELEEIRSTNPSWYSRLEKNPFTTRFPGGESYKDLIRRLESVVVDLEQQVIPTLVVSHVSVLQMLIAYFRRSPVEEAMQIEVPLHSVIKFTPVRGGGWKESQHQLVPAFERSNSMPTTPNKVAIEGIDRVSRGSDLDPSSPSPIWGDYMRKPSSASLSREGRSLDLDVAPAIPNLRR
ncbi:6-phosphofructo-2-kinase-domain containing protein [Nitzschia inconspicua]|uniref:6-phosphofructo-2-kinase-domain containing protein n=1 Tax=Nitzschia inconspicua TaxID=303405 RepID=A0A9K3Q086_9STRA|nr:6-phosphofructo-2-kinase-domain containing protein [Nitzschia inconspicua]